MGHDMWKRAYTALFIALLSTLAIPVRARGDANVEKTQLELRGGSALIFYQPLENRAAKVFGPGWKKADFVDASGSRIPLFPMEFFVAMNGLIFSGSNAPKISPSGKYAVLDVFRTGVVDPGPSGMAEGSSRQYCPVINTASGCLISMQTGELCGGNWSTTTDMWVVTGFKYNATKPMIQSEFSRSNELWGQFLESMRINGAANIKQYIIDNLGVENIMACEPPTIANKKYFTLIARQLRKEGDSADASYIEIKFAAAAIDIDLSATPTINVKKGYLYDRPDIGAKTKAYLVKGDLVKILGKNEGWIRIQYVKKDGTVIDKWIEFISVQ